MFSNSDLSSSLETGLINLNQDSMEHLRPKIVLNNFKLREKVLEVILSELKTCSYFRLGVAFLTRSGVACLHQVLKELENNGIKGQVVISQYLNFSDPNALRALMRFDNIDLKLINTENYHGKCYLFDHKDFSNLIVGSSNLTQNALGKNSELNLKVSLTKKSELYENFLDEFNRLFAQAEWVTIDLLKRYEIAYNANKKALTSSNAADLKMPENPHIIANKMQLEALHSLNNMRVNRHPRCLVISATGTGKTILAALDAKQVDAKKLLFVVHRKTIAKKAMAEFRKVFGNTRTFGLYSGIHREHSEDFIFTTVQTINKDRHLNVFSKKQFDYIIVDETHRAGAATYGRIIDYFEPNFLLGMTATPERNDGFDIFKLFNHKIAYEIRLNKAMEADLLSPFHYYGVTDISVDGIELDDNSNFGLLTSGERVQNILAAIKEYDCDSGKRRGLVFCSKVREAEVLAAHFNDLGIPSKALSGADDEETREGAILRLESDDPNKKLDYIFTVDIFNEGVDIPKVNQILMLRPTASAIIFVQQLGRGLRKVDGKDYLTVIDFIGNYQNNYMIPIALFGDSSYSKDRLRKLLSSGSAMIPGASSVNFDAIAQERIFKSIDTINLQTRARLREDYNLLKFRLGRPPMMMDFVEANMRDPHQFTDHSGSLYTFSLEEGDAENMADGNKKLFNYLCKHVNDGCRSEEAIILKLLMASKNGTINSSEVSVEFEKLTESPLSIADQASAIANLNLTFATERIKHETKPIGDIHSYQIVKYEQRKITLGGTLKHALSDDVFKTYLDDSVQFSIRKFFIDFRPKDYIAGFKRGSKYSRKDVFRILKWDQNPNPQTVGGYLLSPDKSNCPIFVTYHKANDISDTTKYEDRFLSRTRFLYMSKNRRTLNSPDVLAMKNQNENELRMPLFVKKNNDEGQGFYYLGELNAIPESFKESQMLLDERNSVNIVKMEFDIDKSVESGIYSYLTSDSLL